ncbi:cell wall-binding repeat-containing protein [Candidatus Micrarchaeota archaeon]|nr:cell wall-binding repeat-containing protein [Candidatus Micrarchaeota archaeon]
MGSKLIIGWLFVFLALANAQTAVLVNSNDWRDAYVASLYAYQKGYIMRYVQDIHSISGTLHELTSQDIAQVELYSRIDNPVPSFTYQLRQLDIDIRDVEYVDQYELSGLLAEKLQPDSVIVVRDDFAFDALSARYLSIVDQAPIVYAKRVRELPQPVIQSLARIQPSTVYAIGRLGPEVMSELRNYPVERLNGIDEFDTNYYANSYAFNIEKPSQALITTGDILELTILNARENAVFLVPEIGSYSLVQTSNLVNEAGLEYLLGIGNGIASPGFFIKDRTGARIYVKFGTIRTEGNEAMQRQDIEMRLQGYRLPQPHYAGKITGLQADFGQSLGKATGALVASRNQVAPSVDLHATFENVGNIELPVYVLFTIRDSAGNVIRTLQSDPMVVYPKALTDFRMNWEDPPSEGNYDVEATFFTEVYAGITFPSRSIDLDLRWLFVYLFLLAFILALVMLLVMAYYSDRLLKDMKDFVTTSRGVNDAVDELWLRVSKVFK